MILIFLYLYSCILGFFTIKNTNKDVLFKFVFIFFSFFIVLFILNPIKWLASTKLK